MTTSGASEPSAESGDRLKRAIRVSREMVGITSDSELSRQAGVHYDTLMNWYGGRTTPRPFEVRKIAGVLGVAYGDLLAAYDGREPAAVPLEQAVADLIVEIRAAVVDERRARAEMMRMITAAIAGSLSPPSPVATMDVPAARHPVTSGSDR